MQYVSCSSLAVFTELKDLLWILFSSQDLHVFFMKHLPLALFTQTYQPKTQPAWKLTILKRLISCKLGVKKKALWAKK